MLGCQVCMSEHRPQSHREPTAGAAEAPAWWQSRYQAPTYCQPLLLLAPGQPNKSCGHVVSGLRSRHRQSQKDTSIGACDMWLLWQPPPWMEQASPGEVGRLKWRTHNVSTLWHCCRQPTHQTNSAPSYTAEQPLAGLHQGAMLNPTAHTHGSSKLPISDKTR